MENIKELIKEGEELKGTFTRNHEHFEGKVITNDTDSVLMWITKSMRIIEGEEYQGSKSPLYQIFADKARKIKELYDHDFDELVGILKGIEATPRPTK